MTDQPDITILAGSAENPEIHLKEEDLRSATKRARDLFSGLQNELEEREEDFTGGLSFLDLKNDTLLSYMIDVCNIVLKKIRNEQIEGHKSVDRCVEYRVILEKIKGIDQKLAYQLNKLITRPEGEEDSKFDVRNLDVDIEVESNDDKEEEEEEEGEDEIEEEEDNSEGDNCQDEDSGDNSVSQDSDSDDSEVADDNLKHSKPQSQLKTKSKPGVYKPPKSRSTAYKDRNNHDDFYYDEDPNTIVDETRVRVDEDRVRYEEDNYTRLPDSKRKSKPKDRKKKSFKRTKRR